MDKKITILRVPKTLSVNIIDMEMERLRLLAMNPDHPHAVFLFTVERAKDKHR